MNDGKSTNPEEKLRYDLQYMEEQSFKLDVKVVVRQVRKVVVDVVNGSVLK